MSKQSNIATKMAALRELVDWFEGDEFQLELAEEKFQQAAVLAKQIDDDLSTLKNTITVVKDRFDT